MAVKKITYIIIDEDTKEILMESFNIRFILKYIKKYNSQKKLKMIKVLK